MGKAAGKAAAKAALKRPTAKPAARAAASEVAAAVAAGASTPKRGRPATLSKKVPVLPKQGVLKESIKKPAAPKKLAASKKPAAEIPVATPEAPLAYEDALSEQGHSIVCGTDEAGRGPLAGPVVAAAFAALARKDEEVLKLMATANDSKKMTPEQREEVFKELTDPKYSGRVAWAIAEASVQEIDTDNILKAALLAMSRAVQKLEPRPDYVLVDGCNRPPELLKPGECWTRGTKCLVPPRAKQKDAWLPGGVEAVIEGDGKVSSIGAASILAKVHRDAVMEELDKKYPKYGFASHKGYGTQAHIAALNEHGVCAAHRKSFGPVRRVLEHGSLFRAFGKASSSVKDSPVEGPPPPSGSPDRSLQLPPPSSPVQAEAHEQSCAVRALGEEKAAASGFLRGAEETDAEEAGAEEADAEEAQDVAMEDAFGQTPEKAGASEGAEDATMADGETQTPEKGSVSQAVDGGVVEKLEKVTPQEVVGVQAPQDAAMA